MRNIVFSLPEMEPFLSTLCVSPSPCCTTGCYSSPDGTNWTLAVERAFCHWRFSSMLGGWGWGEGYSLLHNFLTPNPWHWTFDVFDVAFWSNGSTQLLCFCLFAGWSWSDRGRPRIRGEENKTRVLPDSRGQQQQAACRNLPQTARWQNRSASPQMS